VVQDMPAEAQPQQAFRLTARHTLAEIDAVSAITDNPLDTRYGLRYRVRSKKKQ